MSQMGNRSVTWEDEDRKTTALSLEDSHRHALYILENKQYKVTGWDAIEQMLSETVTPASIAMEIKQLKMQHEAELRSIYDAHAIEYHDNAKLLYESLEPGQYDADNARKLLSKTHSTSFLKKQWDAEIDHCKTAHLKLILLLQKRMETIEKEEAEREANRRRQFPVSPDDYYTKDEDMQLLVARFLSMNTQDKERMLDKNGWAWAQVQPLIDAFKAPDKTFNKAILARAMDDKMMSKSRRPF